MSTACLSPPGVSRRRRSPSAVTFGGIAITALLAGSAEPTPLLRFYAEAFHLTPPGLTLVFAAYAASLLLALLTLGSLSDHVGRRPMIAAGMVGSILAMILFIRADSLGALVEARVVQGLATGAALAAAGAAMLDEDRVGGALVSSVAAFAGMFVGILTAAILSVHAPHPTVLVYAVTAGVFLLLAATVWLLPETAARHPGAWRALRPRVHVPPTARRMLMLVTPVNVAGWALGGFYLSLMPSLLRASAGGLSVVTGAALIALLPLTGATMLVLLRKVPAVRCIVPGAMGLALGVAVTLAGAVLGSVALLVGGTLVSGIGFGAAFSGSTRGVFPLAGPADRAGLVSAFYVESYLAFSVPALLAGLAIPAFGLLATTGAYGAVLIVLALTSAAAARIGLRG